MNEEMTTELLFAIVDWILLSRQQIPATLADLKVANVSSSCDNSLSRFLQQHESLKNKLRLVFTAAQRQQRQIVMLVFGSAINTSMSKEIFTIRLPLFVHQSTEEDLAVDQKKKKLHRLKSDLIRQVIASTPDWFATSQLAPTSCHVLIRGPSELCSTIEIDPKRNFDASMFDANKKILRCDIELATTQTAASDDDNDDAEDVWFQCEKLTAVLPTDFET